MAFFFFFPILGSPRVGRKHKLVTAGSESTLLFFSMNKLVPSLMSRLLGGKKKLKGNCKFIVENFSLSF